ncbi:MAG: hypothetical protein WA857_03960 [Candidatus Acidiferrum sp.]
MKKETVLDKKYVLVGAWSKRGQRVRLAAHINSGDASRQQRGVRKRILAADLSVEKSPLANGEDIVCAPRWA